MSNTNIEEAKGKLLLTKINLTISKHFVKINLIDVMNLTENDVEQAEQELRSTILEEGYHHTNDIYFDGHPELEGCEGWVHTSFAQSNGETTFSIYTLPNYKFTSVMRKL